MNLGAGRGREERGERVEARDGGPAGRVLVELADGRIVTGCNVENSTYGLTICAERCAIFKAVSEGARPGGFRRIAICADTERLTPPCGACRQILWEFCGDVPVTLVNLAGATREFTLRQLLPEAFDDSLLG